MNTKKHSNAIINNNYGRLKYLIFLFKIPMGTQKDFFEIYRQFGHAPTKRFASPALYPHVHLVPKVDRLALYPQTRIRLKRSRSANPVLSGRCRTKIFFIILYPTINDVTYYFGVRVLLATLMVGSVAKKFNAFRKHQISLLSPQQNANVSNSKPVKSTPQSYTLSSSKLVSRCVVSNNECVQLRDHP